MQCFHECKVEIAEYKYLSSDRSNTLLAQTDSTTMRKDTSFLQHKFQIASFLACSLYVLLAPSVSYAVDNANLEVDGAGNVTIPAGQSTSGFNLVGNGTTGVVPIRIGASATDDATSGVLLGSVSEIGRDVALNGGGTERLWASPSTSRSPSGALSLTTRKAGVDQTNTLFANTAPLDANLNAAYFPFSEGWVGGSVYDTTGDDIYDEFILNGMNVSDINQNGIDAGLSLVKIPGVVDTRRQGIFLANSADDNEVFAMTSPYSDGSQFALQSKPSNVNGQARVDGDSSSFVFIPFGTPNMTLARIHGGNANEAPQAMIASGNAVTMVREAQGRYRLSIAGHSPSTGSLLLNQHGSHDDLETKNNMLGGDPRPSGGNGVDNLPSFVADGNDWIILSEDISDSDPIDGLTGGTADSFPQGQDANDGLYFDLAFVPFANGPTGPGPIPELSTLTGFSRNRVIGWNTDITSSTNGNAPGDMMATVTSSSSGINVSGIGSNKGDLNFYVDGARLATNDGVMLATISEGLRDNSLQLGEFDYGLANTTNQFSNYWTVSTESAAGGIEHNINTAVAFFGADSGFETGTLVDSNDGSGLVEVAIAATNSLTDGVLMATPWGNDDNFATVTPKSDGTGWDINIFDHNTTAEGAAGEFSDGVNYVYLPYDSENLVAGQVNDDGSIVNSTDTNDFTLTRQADGEYLLQIVGKDYDDGMLLLNAKGEGDSVDNSLVYERSGNDFLILGLDMVATTSELVNPEDTAFSFAFIDFTVDLMAPSSPLDGDFDNDNDVDGADFLAWQRGFPGTFDSGDLADWQMNYGGGPLPAAQSVPEPTSAILCVLALMMLANQQTRGKKN